MSFSGYFFKNKEDVEPYLEVAGEGKTFEWAQKHAKALGCYVICSYPEKVIDADTEEQTNHIS
jgi:protein N-terminal amidase